MNCSEFEIELEQLVESRALALSDPAATHVGQCAGCGQRWNDHRLIESALLSWRQVTPHMPSMADHLIHQFREEQVARLKPTSGVGPRSVDTGRRWTAVVVAAACVLMTFGAGILLNFEPGDRRVVQSPTVPVVPSPESSPVGVASSVVAVFDDLRTEYQELAAETSATARGFVVALPPAPVGPWPDPGPKVNTESTHESGDERAQTSSGAVSDLGRSIGTQISQAMDFLWIAVPDSVPRG